MLKQFSKAKRLPTSSVLLSLRKQNRQGVLITLPPISKSSFGLSKKASSRAVTELSPGPLINKSSRNRDVTASSPLDLPQNECPPKPTLTAVNPDWANANQANPNLNPYQAHLNPKKANPKKLQCQAGGKGGGGGGA